MNTELYFLSKSLNMLRLSGGLPAVLLASALVLSCLFCQIKKNFALVKKQW